MMMEEHSDADDPNGDGEGVWSSEIEQCFHEALMLFPPCGRRKHILQEEGGGKMYGRNELIARHIKMKTGKVRTRKQVSSHIQVLARRKAKAENSMEGGDTGTVSSASPASSISVSVSGPGTRDTQIKLPNQQQLSDDLNHYFQHQHHNNHQHHNAQQQLQQQHLQQQQQQQQHLQHHHQQHLMTNAYLDVWNDRPIVTNKIRLVEFSAFIEYRHTRLQPPPLVNNLNAAIVGTANSPVASAISLSNLAGTTPSNNNQTSNITNAKSMESAHGLLAPTFNGVASTLAQHQPHQSVGPLHHPAPPHQHHLPEHYNQYQQAHTGVQLHQPLNNNHQQHHQINQRNNNNNTTTAAYMPATNNVAPIGLNYQQQAASTLALATAATTPTTTTSAGSIRHSYVKIDYRQPICRQINKLERIDISQIQDKFPEITDRLYQRGPSDAFFLVKFWADLNNDYEYNNEDQNSFFGFSCNFETLQPYKDITCSTKACSYGLQVVEKVEKIHGALNNTNGRYTYDIDRSPMCDFMKQFIKKLRQLPMTSQMNSVMENFSVLQVITSESTSEILLCLAFVFEIASTEPSNGCHHHVYKLTKD